MPDIATSTFVFISENQRHRYPDRNLSAINSHIARHAHRNRNNIVSSGQRSKQLLRVRVSELEVRPERISLERQEASLSTSKDLLKQVRLERHDEAECSTCRELSNIASEEPLELSHNRYRIPKCPPYQAFPFFASFEERRSAHYWFTEILKDDFGVGCQLENAFQSQVKLFPLAFEVPMRWIIARAAMVLHSKTGSPPPALVYRSRMGALKKLQQMLRNEKTSDDEVVASILQCISHDATFRKAHLKGLDVLIESRGGLDAVIQNCTVTCAEHVFLVYTLTEYNIMKLSELTSLKNCFFSALLAMRDLACRSLRVSFGIETRESGIDLDDYSTDSAGLLDWRYIRQKRRVFSEETATGQLIRRHFCFDDDLARKSRIFGALFQLNAMLVQYKTNDQKVYFLRRLEEAVKANATHDSVSGLTTMLAGTHLCVVGSISRQIQQELKGERHDEKGVATAVDGIAAMKIYSLLLDSMREELHQCLQGWLLDFDVQILNDGDIDRLSERINQLWMQRMHHDGGIESIDYFQSHAL